MNLAQRVTLKVRLMTPSERAIWFAELWLAGATEIARYGLHLLAVLGAIFLMVLYYQVPGPYPAAYIIKYALLFWMMGESFASVFAGHNRGSITAAIVLVTAWVFLPA